MTGLAKKKWFVPAVIFLLAVIAISSLFESDSKQTSASLSTEQRLEEMCNLIKGVSNAKVMITYEPAAAAAAAFGYDREEEKISGVAIACDGGENPDVKLALYELVDALFDIKSTRITVSPRN